MLSDISCWIFSGIVGNSSFFPSLSPILLALPPGSGHTCCVCPTCWDSLCCLFRLLCFSVFEDCPDKASPAKILFSAVSALLTWPAKALFIPLPVVFIRSIISLSWDSHLCACRPPADPHSPWHSEHGSQSPVGLFQRHRHAASDAALSP